MFQSIINTVQQYVQWLGQVVADVGYAALVQLLGFFRYFVELIWNHTLGIAYYTLSQLFDQMGFSVDIDFSQWLYYFEAANLWLPISEGIELTQAMYSWYLFAFAFRWIKGFLPFV